MTLIKLQKKIDKAAYAYYTIGNPIVDDTIYDSLIAELKKLNPNDKRLTKVGASIRDSILQKQTHSIVMGSLSKCQSELEFKDWIRNNLTKNGISSNELLTISNKMDGSSISLEFRDGKLIEAISRGDGFIGENLTGNALSFKGLPISSKNNFTGFVRGEVVLNLDDWNIIDSDKTSNARNMATGISRRKSGENSDSLTFYAFKLYDLNGNPIGKTEEEAHKKLKDYGFNTVKSFTGTVDGVWKWHINIGKIRSTLNYLIDGSVVCISNIDKQMQLGESSNCPKYATAIKFEAEKVSTTLLNVKFQVGNSGIICPVAILKPVQVGGVTIEYASLYNFNNIEELDLHINDEVEVIRANDVIPCVTQVLKAADNRISIITPTKCPCCNSELEKKTNISGIDSVAIFCINKNCNSQVTGKIEKYVKSLDIQGIGSSVIEALFSQMNIKDAADLYTLKDYSTVLASLTLGDKITLGEKRATKILEEIEKKTKLTLSDFLGSLGINSLGKRRIVLIQEALIGEMDTLDDWFTTKLTDNAQKAGVKGLAYVIHMELQQQKSFIFKFIENGVEITKSKKSSLKEGVLLFCLTGPPMPLENGDKATKEYYHGAISKSGNDWTPSYTKNVNYLVTADSNSTSSKMEKAKKNGTKIINHIQLMKLIDK